MSTNVVRWLATRVGAVVILSMLVTAGLAVPILTMQPEGSASQEPQGEVFEARDLVNERFVSAAYDIPFVVEPRGGDLLRQEALLELLDNAAAMRADPDVGPKLFTFHDRDRGVEVHGVHTLADAVDDALRLQGTSLASADQAAIQAAAGSIIDDLGPRRLGLSAHSERDPVSGEWVVPGLVMLVAGDDELVGGPPAGVQLGIDDTTKEEFNREVEELLRGDEVNIQLWGVGFDVNLTSAEQGEAAGPFIGMTILAVLLVVGLTYRSYWPVAIAGGALAVMIIWLRGLSNLVGMEQDQILATIVPIAMISFGIDFAFHAFGRYREERSGGRLPRAAFTVGLAGVLGALALALGSDAAAFLANTASGIQSLVQFGIAAAFGLFAAFVMLGLVAPAVLMRIEERAGEPPRRRWVRATSLVGSVLAAMTATAAVLLTVFLAPAIGLMLAGLYVIVFVLVPALLAGRVDGRHDASAVARSGAGRAAELTGAVVAGIARGRAVLLPVVLVVTAGCAYFATQVPARFDVKDFFSPSSSFVVSLDKIDEHNSAGGGEPAVVYVEADLTAPASVGALDRFVNDLRALDITGVGRDDDGQVRVEPGVLGLLADAVGSQMAQAAVATTAGIEPADGDGDGYPDTTEQLAAVYDTALTNGLALDAEGAGWTADDVGKVLWRSETAGSDATQIQLFMAGTREQEAIAHTESELQPLIDTLTTELQADSADARAVLTGAPIARQHSLEAISRALQVSLPIAILLCLLIAAAVMRSVRYAVVSIVPIILVVAWLYAFMYAFGFSLNIVTATIGAISIGIGIDYAIHFTMRYREEFTGETSRAQALRATGEGTGLALAASALSSVIGFTVLAFAPMPLFSSYGLLTAVMIVMAVAASLLVLPSLLAAVTRDPKPAPAMAAPAPHVPVGLASPRTGTIAEHLDLTPTPPVGAAPASPPAPATRETVRVSPEDLPLQVPIAIPRTVGGLAIVRSLGRDHHSELYLATAPEQLGEHHVAVRLYDEALGDDEFTIIGDELQAYAALPSPRLARIHDFGLWQHRLYVTSSHLPQGSLADPAQPLGRSQVVKAMADAARAAHDLHESGIVHRDLRPATVRIDGEGAKLVGVGIPQLLAESRRNRHGGTAPEANGPAPAGALDYVEPAVLAGRSAGRASDIWSLGATLHDVLAGTSLHSTAPDPAGRSESVTAPGPQISATLSPEDREVVQRCIDPDRTARFPTALALAESLERLLAGREPAG